MSDKVGHADAAPLYDTELSTGKSLEKQILIDLLVTSAGFGLVVTAVVLAVEGLSLG